jgi:hypothetical protein
VRTIKKETVEAVSMTRFVGTPLRGTEFANAGDEAISARVGTDSYPRVRIDAGGRITWSSGAATGDTTLYRSGSDTLVTDDVFKALQGIVTLVTDGAPTQALPNGAIAIDTTNSIFYFRSENTWQLVSGGGSVTGDIDGGNHLNDIQEAEVTNYVFASFDGEEL